MEGFNHKVSQFIEMISYPVGFVEEIDLKEVVLFAQDGGWITKEEIEIIENIFI